MALETLIHRWDAQQSFGDPEEITVDLAVDGIDEALAVQYAEKLTDNPVGRAGAAVHLHCTDHEKGWIVHLLERGIEIRQGHQGADSQLTGPAAQIWLFLAQRVEISQLIVTGDYAVVKGLEEAGNRLPDARL